MSPHPQPAWTIPDETARAARAAFPQGNAVMQVYDELGILYHDQGVATLFAVHGQPAESPARRMLITISTSWMASLTGTLPMPSAVGSMGHSPSVST